MGTYAGGSLLVQNRHQRKPLHIAGGILGEIIVPSTPTTPSTPAPTRNNRKFSTSATDSALAGRDSSFSDFMNTTPKFTGPSDISQTGLQLHPLLCLSLHEHCYLQDYGVWGREEYVKNWWAFVNWQEVETSFNDIVKSSAPK